MTPRDLQKAMALEWIDTGFVVVNAIEPSNRAGDVYAISDMDQREIETGEWTQTPIGAICLKTCSMQDCGAGQGWCANCSEFRAPRCCFCSSIAASSVLLRVFVLE